MARTPKPLLEKLKENVLQMSVPEIEILIGYAEAVLDVREADAAKKAEELSVSVSKEEIERQKREGV